MKNEHPMKNIYNIFYLFVTVLCQIKKIIAFSPDERTQIPPPSASQEGGAVGAPTAITAAKFSMFFCYFKELFKSEKTQVSTNKKALSPGYTADTTVRRFAEPPYGGSLFLGVYPTIFIRLNLLSRKLKPVKPESGLPSPHNLIPYITQLRTRMSVLQALKLCPLLVMLCFALPTAAQSVVAPGGGEHITDSHSLSFTIGEVAIGSYQQGNIVLLEGFQQGMLKGDEAVTGTVEELYPFAINAYPNPTADKITISLSETVSHSLSYRLYNLQGQLVVEDILTKRGVPALEQSLDLGLLPAGIYQLVIITSGQEIAKIFKLQKVH